MKQGEATQFLNAAEVGKLGGLAEDIRDAVMDYQVRPPDFSLLPCLTPVVDVLATRHL